LPLGLCGSRIGTGFAEERAIADAADTKEIRLLARYQVRPEALSQCLAAIGAFVAYVRAHEPGTLRYEVWQERDDPTRFVHLFIFSDTDAHRRHSESAEVRQFASVLYPACLAPVEFIDYRPIASNLQ
jgi:quinol monooxygenase YgiN